MSLAATEPVAVSSDLLDALRKLARRLGRPESEVVEAALRRYLGLDGLLEEIWSSNPDDLTEREALELAYSEPRAARDERR